MMKLKRGTLLRNKRNLRRAVVAYTDDRTVILRFGKHRHWTTSVAVVLRNYNIV